jgi:hypothetical protein
MYSTVLSKVVSQLRNAFYTPPVVAAVHALVNLLLIMLETFVAKALNFAKNWMKIAYATNAL